MKHIALLMMPALCLQTFASIDEKSAPAKAVDTPAPPETAIKLIEGDWKSVTEIVRKNKGKIVIVDIWSTACLPCMKEFPNLLKLQKKHGKEIVCLSLNVDYAGIKSKPPEYYRPRVEKFLRRQPSACQSLLCNVDALELFDSLKLTSIPAVYVYDREGKLVKRFDDSMFEDGEEEAFTYKEDINPVVAKLISDKANPATN